jgi:hypothetical protein
MTKIFLLFLFFVSVNSAIHAQNTIIRLYDTTLFFDGYNNLDTLIKKGQMKAEAPDNVKRLSTSIYTKKITPVQLALIGDSLAVKIIVKASCDNYDRIAYVGLAMVPKGDTIYKTNSPNVKRIEVARFITPFMNKNIKPDTVPYFFRIDNLASILRESRLLNDYDFWFELSIFGVPYAANTQVAGCAKRNDVFYGSVELYTNAPKPLENKNIIYPMSNQFYLCNYKDGASDSLTKTEKTITVNVVSELTNATLHLITSNHGAGAGGEEYNRRQHYVYFDSVQVKTYKPGETTCEPYRKYNTQGNGIYGATPQSDAQWQSFSNWCPGSTIPIRIINLGTLAKGKHTFKLSVPTAVFSGKDGYFPVSLYLQGKSDLLYPADIDNTEDANIDNILIFPNPTSEYVNIKTETKNLAYMRVKNIFGSTMFIKKFETTTIDETIDTRDFCSGVYFMEIADGQKIMIRKIVVE